MEYEIRDATEWRFRINPAWENKTHPRTPWPGQHHPQGPAPGSVRGLRWGWAEESVLGPGCRLGTRIGSWQGVCKQPPTPSIHPTTCPAQGAADKGATCPQVWQMLAETQRPLGVWRERTPPRMRP